MELREAGPFATNKHILKSFHVKQPAVNEKELITTAAQTREMQLSLSNGCNKFCIHTTHSAPTIHLTTAVAE